VALSGDRVAVIGNIPAEPCDMVLVLPVRELVAGPDALQRALAAALAAPGGPALHDRAISLVVGPGPDDAMVVLRDPEDEEPPDADADPDELPDTWGLRGFYLRSLGNRSIVERAPWDERFHKSPRSQPPRASSRLRSTVASRSATAGPVPSRTSRGLRSIPPVRASRFPSTVAGRCAHYRTDGAPGQHQAAEPRHGVLTTTIALVLSACNNPGFDPSSFS
jgi:hypothetical protein